MSRGTTLFLEDSAALLGLFWAFRGVLLSHALHALVLEGIASIFIGAVLALVGVLLLIESHGLLRGEGVDREMRLALTQLVGRDPDVRAIWRCFCKSSSRGGSSSALLRVSTPWGGIPCPGPSDWYRLLLLLVGPAPFRTERHVPEQMV